MRKRSSRTLWQRYKIFDRVAGSCAAFLFSAPCETEVNAMIETARKRNTPPVYGKNGWFVNVAVACPRSPRAEGSVLDFADATRYDFVSA